MFVDPPKLGFLFNRTVLRVGGGYLKIEGISKKVRYPKRYSISKSFVA